MTSNPVTKALLMLVGGLLAYWLVPAHAANLDDDLARVQHGWAHIYYQLPEVQQAPAYTAVEADVDAVVAAHPGRAEPLVWQAILLSSHAKAQGGLGALEKIGRARDDLLAAEKLDPNALDGSVYTSLGSLYAKAPGWPLSFGDKKKAAAYFQRALEINPTGIDPNFFYGELLAEQKQSTEARRYLEIALRAPARAGRTDADEGRRTEVRAALAKLPEKK